MSEINEKDQSEEYKYRGANQCNVVSPKYEEPIGNCEAYADEN